MSLTKEVLQVVFVAVEERKRAALRTLRCEWPEIGDRRAEGGMTGGRKVGSGEWWVVSGE